MKINLEKKRLFSKTIPLIFTVYLFLRIGWEPYTVLKYLNRFVSGRNITLEGYLKIQAIGMVKSLFMIPIAILIVPQVANVILLYKEKRKIIKKLTGK